MRTRWRASTLLCCLAEATLNRWVLTCSSCEQESVSFQGEFKWPAEFIRAPAGSKLTTFARASELADPNRDSVPANFAGYVLMPFFPWMEMADHPGHLLWHVQGYKIESLNELDEDYLAAARAEFGNKFEQSPELDDELRQECEKLREQLVQAREAASRPREGKPCPLVGSLGCAAKDFILVRRLPSGWSERGLGLG